MMDHRVAQSESISNLIGVPGNRSSHGAVDLSFGPVPLIALNYCNAYGHIYRDFMSFGLGVGMNS